MQGYGQLQQWVPAINSDGPSCNIIHGTFAPSQIRVNTESVEMLKLNQLHSKDHKTIKLENIVGETHETQTDGRIGTLLQH